MKFTFKRTIEIEVEHELPLLGYDIKESFTKSHEEELNEVLSFVGNLEKQKKELDINGKKYYLTVNDKVTNIFKKGFKNE
jgi:chemotaxis protein CheY-P-specific phosphatase CheC